MARGARSGLWLAACALSCVHPGRLAAATADGLLDSTAAFQSPRCWKWRNTTPVHDVDVVGRLPRPFVWSSALGCVPGGLVPRGVPVAWSLSPGAA